MSKTAFRCAMGILAGAGTLLAVSKGCVSDDVTRRSVEGTPPKTPGASVSPSPYALSEDRRPGAPATLVKWRGRVRFHERFNSLEVGRGKRWGWKSAAYSDCLHNSGRYKLDRLDRRALRVRRGALDITATPAGAGRWRTGLITTGDSCGSGGKGFAVRQGDLVVARVRLPGARRGSWPGMWTWRRGNNEVDLFEWHADHPDILEFVSHPARTVKFFRSRGVGRGRWVDIAVHLGRKDTRWFTAPAGRRMRLAFADGKGIEKGFRAHLVVNLSVSDGKLHPRPADRRPIRFRVAWIKVIGNAALHVGRGG
ncbi:hypothetical protein GCM10009678_55170 [Actinomadura kijaniata]|uniref:GH16 domain-containing protein n=1 Tax=Actinomadura namibiensis TaxID=182080 RepID=A0A7W3LLC7_ACTNM|nr:hypothetical protein [Actinomadura namibiensis]MBA8950268.1 hypothetical protein [Actinomadura namibiensis]